MFILVLLLLFLLGDLHWWWLGDRTVRRLHGHAVWRILHGIFMAGQTSGIALLMWSRAADHELENWMPRPWLACIYIWHCLVLLPLALLWIPFVVGSAIVRTTRRLVGPAKTQPLPGHSLTTRRDFLKLAASAAPALIAVGSASIASRQLDQFRVRGLTVRLPNLPSQIEGLTIAHVTDLHVGRFTRGAILGRIVSATNELQSDLVLMTGDLINYALDDLPAALDIVSQFRARHGVFTCEGNHDLFEDPDAFRQRTRAAGIRLLVNETAVVPINGISVQILGLRWGAGTGDPHAPGNRGDRAIAKSMSELLAQQDAKTFRVLLAHHPHAFDYAGDIPLTLAGHTHGGQLMVSESVGFGPALFRYWSGLYQQETRALLVSNGVGNWFPLRTRAPAEIVHLTLRKA